jgi:hypothetical protein
LDWEGQRHLVYLNYSNTEKDGFVNITYILLHISWPGRSDYNLRNINVKNKLTTQWNAHASCMLMDRDAGRCRTLVTLKRSLILY